MALFRAEGEKAYVTKCSHQVFVTGQLLDGFGRCARSASPSEAAPSISAAASANRGALLGGLCDRKLTAPDTAAPPRDRHWLRSTSPERSPPCGTSSTPVARAAGSRRVLLVDQRAGGRAARARTASRTRLVVASVASALGLVASRSSIAIERREVPDREA
jgi:hypothetical protein